MLLTLLTAALAVAPGPACKKVCAGDEVKDAQGCCARRPEVAPTLTPAKVPAPARAALAAAAALRQAKQYDEALASLEQAIQLAPGWPEPLVTRAQVRLEMLGPQAELPNILKVEAGVDYAAMGKRLEAVEADLALLLRSAPNHPDEASWAELQGQVQARLAAAKKADAEVRKRADEASLLRQAEALRAQAEEQERAEAKAKEAQRLALEAKQAAERQRADEEAARLAAARRAQEEARAADEARRRSHEEAVAAARGGRAGAVAMLVVAGVLGAGAVAFAVLGAGVNERVKAGGFATVQDLLKAADLGLVWNVGVGVSAGLGGAALLAGIILLAVNHDPPPLTLAPFVDGGRAGLALGLRW